MEPFQIYLVITANNGMYRANSANLIRKIKMLIKKNTSMTGGGPI